MNHEYEHARVCEDNWRELTENDFDLRALFAEVGVRMALLAQARDLFLVLHITPETPRHFQGDSGLLRTILTTVTGYSLHAVERGGVSILVRSNPLNKHGRHQLEIVVTDTGLGIPPIAAGAGRGGSQYEGPDRTAGAWDGDLEQAARLVRQLAGAFIVTPIFSWGTRYEIRVELMAAKPAYFKKLKGQPAQLLCGN